MLPPLTSEQLDVLDTEFREILQKYFNDQATLECELKAKNERLRVDSEQRYFELEKQQVSDHIRLEAESKAAADLRLQVSDLEKKYGEVTEKYRELQERYFSKSEQWAEQEQALVTAKSRLEIEKSDLSDLLSKRNREVDRLSGEWKQLSDQLNEASRLRISAENEAGEAKSELTILQHRETRLNQELESLKQQNDWLNKEVQERTTELLTSKKEKAGKIFELQSLLDDSIQEAAQSKLSLDAVKNRNVELTEQVEEYLQKLKDARDANAQLEEQYRQELLAQEKLIDLFKNSAEDSEHKVEEMTKAVDELQKLLSQANDVYSELQIEREQDNKLSQEFISERDIRISNLEKELENANELLEVSRYHEKQLGSCDDTEIVSSAAATVSRLVKSGMTLTQIYNEYVKVCTALQTEKDENKRLSDYLNRILHEIEEKAPLMKKQRQDYEKAFEAVTQLTHQLDSAMMECESCRINSENDHRRASELSRENQRFKQQTIDLSRQVKLLLKELEESRGNKVCMTPDGGDMLLASVSSSSLLINEKLVTFRNIEELQEQNQKLLMVVRELSEAQEEKDMETGDKKVAELQQQLDMALKEIETMKENRQRQAEMVESIVQQRDMYRIIATQPVSSPNVSAVQSSPAVDTSATVPVVTGGLSADQQLKAFEDNKNALKELQEEMACYRRERSENERMLNEQLEKTMKEASEFRLQNAKLLSQLDFTGERLKIVQSNSEAHHKEIEFYKDKNNKLMASVAKNQQSVTMLQQDLMSTQEKLTRAEVRCQNLVAEKEILKRSESRLNNEIDLLRGNRQSRDELVVRLESIQNNFERSDFEIKTRLTQQIEKLERENAVLRKKADGTDEQQRAFVNTLERQLSEARQELERQREQGGRLSEQLAIANEHIDFLKKDLSATQDKLQITESKLASVLDDQKGGLTDDSLQYELTRYRDLLADSTREVSSLKAKLEQSERDCQQHRSVAENVEHSLHEHIEASEKFKAEMEQRTTDISNINESLQTRITELEAEIMRLSEENANLANENATLNQDKNQLAAENKKKDSTLANEVLNLRNQLDDTTEKLELSLASEKTARTDCEHQATEARLAQEKYDEEMRSHAVDVDNLNMVKQELAEITEKLELTTAEVRVAQSTLESCQVSWVEIEHGLKSEIEKSNVKLSDLKTENADLHQQLETLTEQMLHLQSHQDSEREHMQNVADSIESNTNTSSAEQLLEVIRYLRKEKELVEARFELLQSETTRLRQQNTNLKRQAEMAEKTLAEEQENSQVNLQTAAQHADLMLKVESLNLLQGSNQQLLEENTRITSQLKELTAKTKQLEDELGPMNETCREVTAQRDALQKEVEILQVEVDRWKARTNHLIEQCNKFDPEEHKKAIAERDDMKRQFTALTEEAQKERSETDNLKQQLQAVSYELNELKTSVEAKDNDVEEKNKTIAQLRKIGRKYRMQAEEVQKELDELKTKTAAAEESSQSDSVELRIRLAALEKERDDLAGKLGNADLEKNEAVKKAKEAVQRELRLLEQVSKLTEENNVKVTDYEALNKENQNLVTQQKKEFDERSRLESENASIAEDKKKLVATLQTAKQRLVSLRSEKEQLEANCAELRKQIDAGTASTGQRIDFDKSAELRSEISRLESEMSELQQSRTAVQLENQQQLEAIEKLRRENQELQQKIQLLQSQRESSKMTGASPAKPTVSAPPVERAVPVSVSTEQQVPLRKANIRPMASQQIHVRSVQPVRSSATEPRAMASIRPMAAAMMSSSSNISTPMATVMPTTAAMSENEGTLVLASVAPQSVQQQAQQQQQSSGRPTQQVQPVPSHFEEATVSSSEEQQQDAGQWWPFDATPSTSSEHSTANSGITGLSKRPRDEAHVQEDGPSEIDIEAPTKRSKQSASEMADTTETSNNAMLPPSAESEREAASVAQVEVQVEPVIEVRRETEPVTTSLSMEVHSRGCLDILPEDYLRKLTGEHSGGSGQSLGSDDLPDYQEQCEQAAALDYDIRPSTSHTNSGTPLSDEAQDDNGEQATGEEYQTGDDAEQGMEDEDIILVDDEDDEDDDIDDDNDDGVNEGDHEDYRNSDDEAEHAEDPGDYYQHEEDDYEIDPELDQGDEADEGEDGYEVGDDLGDKEAQQENYEVDDVIIVEGDSARQTAGRSAGLNARQRRVADQGMIETSDQGLTATVTTSVPSQSHATVRHMVMPVISAATTGQQSSHMSVVPTSTSQSVRLPMPSSVSAVVLRQQQQQQQSSSSLSGQQLSSISRSSLMPFLFGSDSALGGGEIGDDSIVPSTPTLQLPRRSDGFAEAVCSPQVYDEGFRFNPTEMTPRSELAHQEGVGVADTRMDFSQFDEAGRSLVSSQPGDGLMENDAESSNVDAQVGSGPTLSEASLQQSVGKTEQEQQQHSDSVSQEEQPSTSQQDRNSSSSSQDKQELFQSQSKPKIQRIVWEPEPRSSTQAATQPSSAASGSVQGTVAPLMQEMVHPRRGTPRGSYRTASGSYRGGQPRGSSRTSVQQGGSPAVLALQRHPGAVLQQRHPQVARRASRGRGTGPRGYY